MAKKTLKKTTRKRNKATAPGVPRIQPILGVTFLTLGILSFAAIVSFDLSQTSQWGTNARPEENLVGITGATVAYYLFYARFLPGEPCELLLLGATLGMSGNKKITNSAVVMATAEATHSGVSRVIPASSPPRAGPRMLPKLLAAPTAPIPLVRVATEVISAM